MVVQTDGVRQLRKSASRPHPDQSRILAGQNGKSQVIKRFIQRFHRHMHKIGFFRQFGIAGDGAAFAQSGDDRQGNGVRKRDKRTHEVVMGITEIVDYDRRIAGDIRQLGISDQTQV